MAAFFPLLFHDYWSRGAEAADVNLRLGLASGAASLVVAVAAPLLGAMADAGGIKKRLLALFVSLGVVCTGLLVAAGEGEWQAAAVLYALATIGFMGANVFYDALLVSVARPERWHFVSGLGFGLGYLGGGLLFAGCLLARLHPEWFGADSATQASRYAFVVTAAWWALFALPLFAFVSEPAARRASGSAVRAGLRQVVATLRSLRHHRAVALFLLAYWLYIDGVDTVVRMAVSYGISLGLGTDHVIQALLVVQFVGFPAAIAFGHFGERIGPKRGIYLGLAVYVLVCAWATLISRPWEFYLLAVMIGLVQGGVQALSRSYFARLIPSAQAGQFFGFYNLLGKFATLLGPPLFGLFGAWFGDVRYSMLALVLLFAAGAGVLHFVPEQRRPAHSV